MELCWWWRDMLYRAGLGGCPECRRRNVHKFSCGWESRERYGGNH